jgi:hypothetical protein
MWSPGIAIGGAAALALACGAVAWVGTRPAIEKASEETANEGMLISRKTLDEILGNVRDDKFVCPNAIQGEFMGATDSGNVYRVSCASSMRRQASDRFRITVRPYAQTTVEPW